MKNIKLLITMIIGFSSLTQAQSNSSIVLKGVYYGRNLYVQNSFGTSGVGFCATKVLVNGDPTTDPVSSSAFEIDLSLFPLQIGDPIEVEIVHQSDCKPKVINAHVLKPRSTYEVTSIEVTENQILKWETKNEQGRLTYFIQQYRWNKWVPIGQIEGVGTSGLHSYSFKITSHTGNNKFRVKQIDSSGKPRISKVACYNNADSEVSFFPSNVKNELIFTKMTAFEIFDQYGNLVKKGVSDKVDCSSLKKGNYYLNFDNAHRAFTKI